MEAKTTHINRQRKIYADNRRHIISELGINDYVYDMLIVDTGLMFLREVCPRDDEYNKHKLNKDFWAWFKHEFKVHEKKFIKAIRESGIILTELHWKNLVHLMTVDYQVTASFYNNYLFNHELNK